MTKDIQDLDEFDCFLQIKKLSKIKMIENKE